MPSKRTNPSLLAAVILVASSNVGTSANTLRKVPDHKLADNVGFKKDDKDSRALDEVLAKKEKDEVTTIANANRKATTLTLPKGSNVMKRAKPSSFESKFKKDTRAKGTNDVKDESIMPDLADQDSGIIPRSLHDDSPLAKMNLRRIFYPFQAKNANKLSEVQLYRMLASCSGSGACMNSPSSCMKNGSCSGNFSCSNSPNLLVEEDACSGPFACSDSSSLTVGMGSCTGGYNSYDFNEYYSCFQSPNGCIGQGSCLGQEYGACRLSPGIFVGDESCLENFACEESPSATIKQSSCHGTSACNSSPNITVDKYSCGVERACRYSPGATIGKYACNCRLCCRYLNESCVIPDFQCNNESVPDGDCSFEYGNPGCPDFSNLI